jgi:Protein of unknown function (DUF2721)
MAKTAKRTSEPARQYSAKIKTASDGIAGSHEAAQLLGSCIEVVMSIAEVSSSVADRYHRHAGMLLIRGGAFRMGSGNPDEAPVHSVIIDEFLHRSNAGDEPARVHLKSDLPRLKQRAVLLNRAILYASISAIFATVLVMVAFVSAFFGIQHERGMAVLFIVTLGFFAASLINLARETRIALHEFDYY